MAITPRATAALALIFAAHSSAGAEAPDQPLLSADELEYLRLLGESAGRDAATRDWELELYAANTGLHDRRWSQGLIFNRRHLFARDDELSLNLETDSYDSAAQLGVEYFTSLGDTGNWHWRLTALGQDLDIEEDPERGISRYEETISSLETGLLWDFARGANHTATLEAGLQWDRIDIDYLFTELILVTRRVAAQQELLKPFAALHYFYDKGDWRLSSSLRFTRNLPSATDDNTAGYVFLGRLNVATDYEIVRAAVNSRWRHAGNRQTRLRLWGHSGLGDRLIPQEQAVVGGMRSIRGYPDGQVAADQFWGAGLEHQWQFTPRSKLLSQWSLAVFVEAGWFDRPGTRAVFRNLDVPQAIQIADEDDELASIGLSSRWVFTPNLELVADWGLALKEVAAESQQIIGVVRTDGVQRLRLNPEAVVERGDSELHLSITLRF